MNYVYNGFIFNDDKTLIQFERVYEMLSKTYWANERTKEIIKISIKNSLCFGVFKNNIQIGFARCIAIPLTIGN